MVNKNKLTFDTKEEMENFINSKHRNLTKEEIEQIYNNGKSLKYNFKIGEQTE